MKLSPETLIGQLATERPLSTRVFARHGIDFCCGGGRPIGEVCEEKGLSPHSILAEIDMELASTDKPAERWDNAPLGDLIDHILKDYHEPLWEEMPRLEAMARKVFEVHGAKDPEMLGGIMQEYIALAAELDQHMRKEEQILFPMIRAGQGTMAGPPIDVMNHEHDTAGEALRRLRELTNDFQVPEGACNTWRALWHGLEALEKDLHQHIHLENNILFPRALKG